MVEVELPELGRGVTSGEVLGWTVGPGDRVAAGDVLLEVETEKSVVEVPAPVGGTLASQRVAEGDVVDVGAVLGTIDADEVGPEAGDGETASVAADGDEDAGGVDSGGTDRDPSTGRVYAPPRVRRLARELGVDLAAVGDRGASRRVSAADVREASGAATDSTALGQAVTRVGESDDDGPKSAVRRVGEASAEGAPSSGESQTAGGEGQDTGGDGGAAGEDEAGGSVPSAAGPVDATTGAGSATTVQHLAVVPELVEARDRLGPLASERDVSLSYTPFVLKAVVAGLADHPLYDPENGGEVTDLGVLPAGTDVASTPVVDRVADRGLLELAAVTNTTLARARGETDGAPSTDDGSAPPVTVTEPGALGDGYVAPCLGDLGPVLLVVGSVRERPVVGEDGIALAPTVPLSLAVARPAREATGARQFLESIEGTLAEPLRLVLA